MKINNLKDLLSDIDFDLSWPTRQKSLDKFENFNPIKYAKTRNFLHGQVSKLSPLIKHGVITNRKLLFDEKILCNCLLYSKKPCGFIVKTIRSAEFEFFLKPKKLPPKKTSFTRK